MIYLKRKIFFVRNKEKNITHKKTSPRIDEVSKVLFKKAYANSVIGASNNALSVCKNLAPVAPSITL